MSRTKQKILQVSLMLFNQKGERVVTTNHIASEAGISSGNLYYHFKNKGAIIRELFNQYQAETLALLQLPENRMLTPDDKIRYFQILNQQLWSYRFLHREIYHLMEYQPDFRALYPRFASQVMRQGKAIYQGFVDAQVMTMTASEIEALVINLWIVLTNWSNFLSMSGHIHPNDHSEQWVMQAMRQMLFLEGPYLTGDGRVAYEKLIAAMGNSTLFAQLAEDAEHAS